MELFSSLKQNSENNTYQLELIPWKLSVHCKRIKVLGHSLFRLTEQINVG